MTIPTISSAPSNLKSDLSFFELAFELSLPLPVVKREGDIDPELQVLTNLFLVGEEDTGIP